MRNYNMKTIDVRIISYLFLLLIVIDFIQAVSKVNYEDERSQLNKKLNKRLLNHIKKRLSRKQSSDSENHNGPLLNADSNGMKNLNDGADDKIYNELDEDHNEIELDAELEAEENAEYETNVTFESGRNVKTRSLAVGDTFTTKEMLEVAKKLLSKVKKPGKGIVSSSKNPYELTDKLFEGYFLTFKRIVVLRDIDIDGLDALQALSLNGDIVDTLRSPSESYTESPNLKGFKVDPSAVLYGYGFKDFPMKCHYKVLKKVVIDQTQAKNNDTKGSKRRQALKLKKTLGKNRKLVLNPGRRGNEKFYKDEDHDGKYPKVSTNIKKMAAKISKDKPVRDKSSQKTTGPIKNKKLSTKTGNKEPLRTKNEQQLHENNIKCRWKYACDDPWYLITCRLHSVCSNDDRYKYVFEREENENLRRFHEMVGIDIIDEEVEKILQVHISRLKPENMASEKDNIESLTQYFNRIISTEDTTHEMRPDNDDDLIVTEDPGLLMEERESNSEAINEAVAQADADDAEARRILGLSPVPYKATKAIPK